MFQLNHQVDDGDVAFVLRAIYTPHDIIQNKGRYARQGILHAIDPICNLATVNYVLHGIQRYGFDPKNTHWNTLWIALGLDTHFHKDPNSNRPTGRTNGQSLAESMLEADARIQEISRLQATNRTLEQVAERMMHIVYLREARRAVADYMIREVIRPFGVPKGSEKQGGQHQGLVNRSVTWPVDLVTTLLIDGKVINLVNFWRQDEISAGDDLIFYLKEHASTEYVLSHHPKSYKKLRFPALKHFEIPRILATTPNENTAERELQQRLWDVMGELSRVTMMTPPTAVNVGNPNAAGNTIGWNEEERYAMQNIQLSEASKGLAWIMQMARSPQDFNRISTFFMEPDGTNLKAKKGLKLLQWVTDTMLNMINELDPMPMGTASEQDLPAVMPEAIWQLVPGVASSRKPGVVRAVWRHGYWHIARSQIMQFAYDGNLDISSGCDAALGGKLLEATFVPTWVEPLEAGVLSGSTTYAGPFTNGLDDHTTRRKRQREGTDVPGYEVMMGVEVKGMQLLEQGRVLREQAEKLEYALANNTDVPTSVLVGMASGDESDPYAVKKSPVTAPVDPQKNIVRLQAIVVAYNVFRFQTRDFYNKCNNYVQALNRLTDQDFLPRKGEESHSLMVSTKSKQEMVRMLTGIRAYLDDTRTIFVNIRNIMNATASVTTTLGYIPLAAPAVSDPDHQLLLNTIDALVTRTNGSLPVPVALAAGGGAGAGGIAPAAGGGEIAPAEGADGGEEGGVALGQGGILTYDEATRNDPILMFKNISDSLDTKKKQRTNAEKKSSVSSESSADSVDNKIAEQKAARESLFAEGDDEADGGGAATTKSASKKSRRVPG